jgi:ribosomal protein uL23
MISMAKDEKSKQKKEERAPLVDPWSILLHPLLTEKAIGKIESENKLVFIVNRSSDKKQIKWAIERAFSVKVDNVTTLLDRKGRKKAWIKLSKEYSASDIATRLGML